MPENTVQITLQIKDDGTIAIIDQTKGKIEGLEKATIDAGSKGSTALASLKSRWLEFTVAAGSIYAVTKGLNAFVNEAAEAEKIESRMAFQIEAAGIKYEKVKKTIDGYANSIMATTRFSDEAAREGLGKMMQYTTNLDAAVKNLSLAMDMSTQTGESLDSTVRLIGMAMNGNVEILGRWIPELRDLDSKLDENASKADKAAYAIDILNKKFSGAAQKDLDTYVGKLERLKNQWKELKEWVGEKLLPVFDDYLWFINHVTGFHEKASKATKDLAADTKDLAEASKEAQSIKYTLGMKGVAEEAAEFRKDLKTMFQSTEALDDAFKTLGVSSQRSMAATADWTLRALTTIQDNFKKGKASVVDYVNALNAAADAMKKLAGEDVSEKRTEAWDKNAETIKGISKDEEGWLKKVNQANDELFKTLKDLDKLKVPTHADVGPMEAEVNAMKEKLRAQGLIIPVTTAETSGVTGSYMTTKEQTGNIGGGVEWLNYVKGGGMGGQTDIGGMGAAIDRVSGQIRDAEEHGFTIPVYMEGSTRKPFSEKIREMIAEFGGLEKAMSGMEAEINVAELSAEYKKLETKLNQVERILPDMSAMASATGGNPYVGGPIVQTVKDLTAEYTEQMKILQMKMDYQMLRAYGGSMQTGGIVPFTGLYQLHVGEKVTPKDQISMGGINIGPFTVNGAKDPKATADEIVQIVKYNLNSELTALLKRR